MNPNTPRNTEDLLLLFPWPSVPILNPSPLPGPGHLVGIWVNSRARPLLSADGAGCWISAGLVVGAFQAGG